MVDLKRDMAILATSGKDWSDRTKRLASRLPDLDIFSQGFVERESAGWRITDKGRAALEFMEARPGAVATAEAAKATGTQAALRPFLQLAERARRRRHRRERRREARERARVAS